MIKYGFFNSKRLITGDYDRKYNADDVNAYFKGAISRDGIYQFVGNQCRVITGGGMNVIVQNGKGQINYHWFEVASNEVVSIRDAHATLNRWTAVVARYDEVNRNIYLTTIDGTESERPNKPQIQRTDALRDICLAYVYVAAGATEIVRDNIIDTVDDIEVCGFVSTLLTGTGGVKKVHQLPIPSSTCQGDIYYLIEESKTAGKKYIKGYYYCEPSKTEYDYVDVDWIADSLSNRPVASEAYLNIVFFGNDNNLWYRCVETSENVYEWQEIAVNQVEELPEPTEDLNNQYYVIGSSLYKVAKQESNYKWYMFGVGGGGGHGDYAIIRIEYPEGTEVQVTYDGDTIDAPDTSGVWIYGCDSAGTYIVGIKNTSTTQEVVINAAGQVENVWISSQVINYKMLYYLGEQFATEIPNEFADGGAILTGGWSNMGANYNGLTGKMTTATISGILIDKDFYSFIVIETTTAPNWGNYTKVGIGSGVTTTPSIIGSSAIDELSISSQGKRYIVGNNKVSSNSERIVVGGVIQSVGANGYSTESEYDDTGNRISMIPKFANSGSSKKPAGTCNVYAVALVHDDDISGLSDYGNDIATILNNSAALFADVSALNWMALNCTGYFMVKALTNATFAQVMNASSNKSILLANKHWARFMALLN